MSPNKRIFLNIVATYGRSLCAHVLGLLAFGQEDYNVCAVAGETVVLSFLPVAFCYKSIGVKSWPHKIGDRNA